MDTERHQGRQYSQENITASSAALSEEPGPPTMPEKERGGPGGLDGSRLDSRDQQPLTEQQSALCRHYAREKNGASAYLAAYPGSQSLSCTVRSEYARRLLRKPWILGRIADLRCESRSEWCARAKLPAPKGGAGLARCRTAPPQAHAVLERLALLAFDRSQIGFIRLAALRRPDAGLENLAHAVSTDHCTPIIRVAISVKPHPFCEESPGGSSDTFVSGVQQPRESRARAPGFARDSADPLTEPS